MALKPPSIFTGGRSSSVGGSGLEYEIAQEQAISLGRAGRRLEAALAALAAFDSRPPGKPATAQTVRAALVAEAAEALWMLVVQREALGLYGTAPVLRDYHVPPEVAGRMGPASAGGG